MNKNKNQWNLNGTLLEIFFFIKIDSGYVTLLLDLKVPFGTGQYYTSRRACSTRPLVFFFQKVYNCKTNKNFEYLINRRIQLCHFRFVVCLFLVVCCEFILRLQIALFSIYTSSSHTLLWYSTFSKAFRIFPVSCTILLWYHSILFLAFILMVLIDGDSNIIVYLCVLPIFIFNPNYKNENSQQRLFEKQKK